MNERIRAKIVRGKLPDIKRPGTDIPDTPAIMRMEAERKKNQRCKRKHKPSA